MKYEINLSPAHTLGVHLYWVEGKKKKKERYYARQG